MAKRYFSHSELKSVNNRVKPGGTMGNHYLEVCDLQDGSVLVEGFNPPNLSKQERRLLEKYQEYLSLVKGGGEWFGQIPTNPIKASIPVSKVILRPDWTLGYDCGEVWAIQPVHLIKDPIRRALREAQLPKSCINWVDDLYSVSTDSEDFVSSRVIITRSSRIYDRASMAKTYRIETVHVLKGTSPDLVAQAIKEPKRLNDIFGPLEPKMGDISHWKENLFFVGVERHTAREAYLRFQTGDISLYFNHSGEVIGSEGRFHEGLEFAPNQKWEGRGYSGGHVSVGSNVDQDEHLKKMYRLILSGKKGKDLTTWGNTSGYYPAVEWEE